MSDIAGDAANAAAGVDSSVGDAALGGTADSTSTDSTTETINPAWSPLLDKLPEGYRPMVIPHLREWDQNYERQRTEVQSQYAHLDPYKDLPAERLEQATKFFELAEQNPRFVYDQLKEFFGFDSESGQGQQGASDDGVSLEDLQGDENDITQNPQFQKLAQDQELLAQVLASQAEKEQRAELEKQVDSEMAEVIKNNPQLEGNEQALITMFEIASASNLSLADAAKRVIGLMGPAAPRPNAPSVMSSGGGVPAVPSIDPATMDKSARRSLVADLINQQLSQG